MPSRGPKRTDPGSFSTDAGRALDPLPVAPAEPTPSVAAESIAAAARRRRPHLPPLPTPTTRVTVDLPVRDHRALKRTADDLADDLDLGTVPIGHVLAALAQQLTADADLRTAVAALLRDRITTDT